MKTNLFRAALRSSAALSTHILLGAAVSGGLMLTLATPAVAQDYTTGVLAGRVTGADGAPVTGAQVVARSLDQGFQRTTTTNANGEYRVPQLAIGTYEITVTASGFTTTRVEQANVSVGAASVYNVQLGSAQAADAETIVVTGRRVGGIDFRSTESGLTVDIAQTMSRVPVARTLSDVVQLAPSVTGGDSAFGTGGDNSQKGGNGLNAAIGGSSVAENAVYINGFNVTNFRNGLGGNAVPFDFYKVVEVKTGGYQAEFGRSTGGVLNVVTQSGSNTPHFGVNLYWTPDALRSDAPNTRGGLTRSLNQYDESTQFDATIYASGALIKDRLFVYGILAPQYFNDFDAYDDGTALRTKMDDPFWGGKADFLITDDHRLEFTFFSDKQKREDTQYAFDAEAGQLGEKIGTTRYRTGGYTYIGRYTGVLTDWLTASALYGQNSYERFAGSPLDVNPAIYDGRTGGLIQLGNWTNFTPETGKDKRKLYRADLEATANLLGQHRIKFGVDREELTAASTLMYSGGQYIRYYESDPEGNTGSEGAARIRVLESGGTFKTVQTAFYLQDYWDVTDRLTLSLGIRNETFDNRNADGDSFVKVKNQWAPRIGVTFDPKGDRSSKITAFYGRYYLPVASNTNIRLSGKETFTEEWYLLNGVNPDGTPVLGALTSSRLLSPGVIPQADTVRDLNLKPMYSDEFILGYEQNVFDDWRVGIRGIYRKLGTAIDDITVNSGLTNWINSNLSGAARDAALTGLADYGPYFVLANPGRSLTFNVDSSILPDGRQITLTADQLGYPTAKRKYKAVELTFDKPWNGVFSLQGSYTWALSKGNYEGAVKSDNGQDDAGITQDFDEEEWMEGAYGYLPNHRRHTFKLFGAYQVTDWFRLGGNLLVQSPRKFGCIGVYPGIPADDHAAGASSWYCGNASTPRGSQLESDWLKQIDLSFAFTPTWAALNGLNPTFRVDVFNVLNSKSKLDLYEYGEDDSRTPRDTYGLVTGYQTPRYVRFTASFAF